MANEFFLDSSYAIALAASSDQLHARAIELADDLVRQPRSLITTRAVLLEIGNALAKRRYRPAAIQLLSSIESDPTIEIVGLTNDLHARGWKLYCERADKDWSLVDCISFVVMTERNVAEALTSDEHFEQAGYVALLRGR